MNTKAMIEVMQAFDDGSRYRIKTSEEYIIPTDGHAQTRPECEFSNNHDFSDKYNRTLIAVLSGESGKDKYICAYSWRTSDEFKYCRMKVKP